MKWLSLCLHVASLRAKVRAHEASHMSGAAARFLTNQKTKNEKRFVSGSSSAANPNPHAGNVATSEQWAPS